MARAPLNASERSLMCRRIRKSKTVTVDMQKRIDVRGILREGSCRQREYREPETPAEVRNA